MKTGESITTKDIEKAKRYKEKYNTDNCILVTTKSIIAKDTKNHKVGFIGKRDGILLVHKSVAVAISEETRNCIIKNTRLANNSNGRYILNKSSCMTILLTLCDLEKYNKNLRIG